MQQEKLSYLDHFISVIHADCCDKLRREDILIESKDQRRLSTRRISDHQQTNNIRAFGPHLQWAWLPSLAFHDSLLQNLSDTSVYNYCVLQLRHKQTQGSLSRDGAVRAVGAVLLLFFSRHSSCLASCLTIFEWCTRSLIIIIAALKKLASVVRTRGEISIPPDRIPSESHRHKVG
jgi:hypothetical protein